MIQHIETYSYNIHICIWNKDKRKDDESRTLLKSLSNGTALTQALEATMAKGRMCRRLENSTTILELELICVV